MSNFTYPTELIEQAKFEIETFQRVGSETGKELLAEVIAWRTRFPEYVHRPQDECVALKLTA